MSEPFFRTSADRPRATTDDVTIEIPEVFANPPNGYELALAKGKTQPAAETTERTGDALYTDPPDGYALALARRKQEEQ